MTSYEKHGIWDSHTIGAMQVFSTAVQYLSNFFFFSCSYAETFILLAPSVTMAKHELLR